MIAEKSKIQINSLFSVKNFLNEKKQRLLNRKKTNLSVDISDWLKSVSKTKNSWK